MAFNVMSLVNTYHALGSSAYLMLDALLSFRWPLRTTDMRLNTRGLN